MTNANGMTEAEQKTLEDYKALCRRRGLEVLEAMGADGHPKLRELDEEFWQHTVEQLFGGIFTRPGLSLRDRELITMAALIALFRIDALDLHLRAAPSVGISDTEIRELIIQVMYYTGWAAGAYALQKHKQVRQDMGLAEEPTEAEG